MHRLFTLADTKPDIKLLTTT